MIEDIKKLIIKYKEIILYVIMGAATTIVNWAVYALMTLIMNTGAKAWGYDVDIFVSTLVAWIAGVAFAFVTNKVWVFESKSWKFTLVMKELSLFVLARLATGFLEWFGTPALVKWGLNQTLFGVKGSISKIVVSIAVVILNYVFSKLIIFKKKENKEK